MATPQSYVIPLSDLRNDQADPTCLKMEIEKNADIVIQLKGLPKVTVISGTNSLVVTFKDTLPAPQESAFNDVIAAHEGMAAPVVEEVHLVGTKATEDNRLQVSNQSYPRSNSTQFVARGDDMDTGQRRTGTPFRSQWMTAGDHVVDWNYIDRMFIWGGEMWAWGGSFGDHISMVVMVPSNAPLLTADPGAGNVNLMDVGGYNIIIPAPLNDGSHQFDYISPRTAGVTAKPMGYPIKVTKASPVPATVVDEGTDVTAPDGFWSYDEKTGEFAPAIGTQGEKLGTYNFFDIELPINAWVVEVSLADPYQRGVHWEQDVPSAAAAVLPHWTYRSIVHIENAPQDQDNGVIISWLVNAAREVPI